MPDLEGGLGVDSETAAKLRDAGYDDLTTIAVASSMELASVVDISDELASEIRERAFQNVDIEGFQRASEVEEPPDLLELDVPKEVEGWVLTYETSNRLAWSTPSGYMLTLGGVGLEVSGPLPPEGDPNEDFNPRKTKVRERTLNPEFDEPSEAIGYAVGWMESHSVEFDEPLTEFTGISDRTAEYLLLKHDVRDHQDLYELHKNSILTTIVGPQYHDDLNAEIDEVFGSKI